MFRNFSLLIKDFFFSFLLTKSFSCAYCQEQCHPSIQIRSKATHSRLFRWSTQQKKTKNKKNSLPSSDNILCLLASPSDNTHSLLQVSLASASLAAAAILTLSGSDPGPLSAPRSLEVIFAPSDLRTLGSSSTLGNKYSFCPLGSRRCSNDSAVAHSETFALTSNPTLSFLVICTSTFVLSCFSCVHSRALPPTGGQWIPPLPPNVTDRASACIWHQNKDKSTNEYNKMYLLANLGT